MPELVTIPTSYFELVVDYVHPNLKISADRATVIQVVFDALKPWNPTIDDIEVISAGKISEQGFTVKLPLRSASFFFGLAMCRFTQDAVTWDSAEDTINILNSAFTAFSAYTGVVLGDKRAAIGIHLQPQKLTFLDLLKPFLHPSLIALDAAPLRTGAVILKWEKRKVTLDGSAVLANGVFLKIERTFENNQTHSEIADQLKTDEDELLKLLGVEEDRK